MFSVFVSVFPRRKLHCTRNFIHMNLFVSFILRAISVFIKDGVLYAKEDSEHCFIHTVSSAHTPAPAPAESCRFWRSNRIVLPSPLLSFSLPSLKLECRAVMIFFHYCVLSNYFWLFIEGLYLFTLLVETFFPEKRYFYWYIIIGWGETPNTPYTALDSHLVKWLIFCIECNAVSLYIFLFFTIAVSIRDPHGLRDHLGRAEAAL